ncbi:MAG: hypothetical protein FD156_1298 [Nitrospirae bacterium]|nr:MAG: hypothetical protein FD156_1298 [Nitrospirota bacterium]
MPFIVSDLNGNSFRINCQYKPSLHKDFDRFVVSTHLMFGIFIMSLNIATVGYFTWDLNLSPKYKVTNAEDGKPLGMLSLHKNAHYPSEVVDITDANIRKAILILGVLTRQSESIVVQEYLRGILHISLNFTFIDFSREAFGNFYRSFENVATEKILKVTKLNNELKELQQALRIIGLKEDIIKEFKLLYRLRSAQIMHAQKKQIKIELDDVFKMKVILDCVLHHIYKPIWTTQMNELLHEPII